MIDWEIKNDGKVLEYMRTFPEALLGAVEEAIGVQILKLSRRVQSKLSGDVLKMKTGELRAAIARGTSVKRSNTKITGEVGLAGASAQVAIAGGAQEFGADIPAHIVRAVNVSKLRFQISGKFKFAREVSIPALKIPERSFLRSSMNEMRDGIMAEITAAAQPVITFKGLL